MTEQREYDNIKERGIYAIAQKGVIKKQRVGKSIKAYRRDYWRRRELQSGQHPYHYHHCKYIKKDLKKGGDLSIVLGRDQLGRGKD